MGLGEGDIPENVLDLGLLPVDLVVDGTLVDWEREREMFYFLHTKLIKSRMRINTHADRGYVLYIVF